jgi:uncharacterized membrane protein
MAFCSKCGAQVTDGAGFCPACGTAVGAQAAGSAATGQTSGVQSSGMQSNVAGLLSYILIIGIIFLFVEPLKSDKFVRFHAFQSIFYWVAVIVIFFCLGAVLPFGLWIAVYWPLRVLTFVGMVFLMYKAYNNERFKLPFIGELAEKQAAA